MFNIYVLKDNVSIASTLLDEHQQGYPAHGNTTLAISKGLPADL